MNKTKRNKKRKKKFVIRTWHYLFLFGIAFLSFIFLFGEHGIIRYYQLKKRKDFLKSEILKMKSEQEKLQKEIEMLTNNYRYIEKVAREKYQMGKPGEKIYIMVKDKKK